ncbi:DUF1761 domain-containing protein [Fertoebacter nigrum]|uniref:DUF1761 domain-containing protein n=1 Tax=Fertoeibacter niger TaxID=2656921 RepID=A0A8X8H2W8_9RHOB|nr:DUF1761 domain-containing protein [Fertoeibacter niger]NUB45314.1 DUF1761 domain-containing protein [Fertoeibacter niger]
MGFLAVLVAAVAGFAVGAVWYMTLSAPWIAASGVRLGPDGRPAKAEGVSPMIIGFVAMVVVAGMMRHVFAMSAIDTVFEGLTSGLGIGAFFITPWLAMCYGFAGRPARLAMIDGGYAVAGCGVIGLVLALF